MGISFKIAKTGTRYRPKLFQLPDTSPDDISNEKLPPPRPDSQPPGLNRSEVPPHKVDSVGANDGNEDGHISPEHEVSFSLNLFLDGFSIGKPAELLQDVPKLLHPYNKESDCLFSAIEYGCLPGDILDDIPCKYLNGTIVCVVCDYRNCMLKSRGSVSSGDRIPNVHKVRLKMCMENVVKDMPYISDDSWGYRDLLEVESQIVKALQPNICLDPNPFLDRLCEMPVPKKLNLGILGFRWKRKQDDAPANNIVPNNLFHEQNISNNLGIEYPKYHRHSGLDSAFLHPQHPVQSSIADFQCNAIRQDLPMTLQPNYQAVVTCSVPTVYPEQDLTDSYSEPRNPGILLPVKRDRNEVHPTSGPTLKKPKKEQLDLIQQQLVRSQQGALGLKSTPLQQQLEAGSGRCSRIGGQQHPQVVTNDNLQANLENVPREARTPFYSDPRGLCYGVKDEVNGPPMFYKPEVKNTMDGHNVTDINCNPSDLQQSQLQHLSPFTQSHFPPPIQWNNPSETDLKRDGSSQKRKSSQSPRVSTGGPVHSPASSKSGEISSYPLGGPYSTRPTTSAVGMHKQKAVSMSSAAVGTAALSSGHNDSFLRENKQSGPAKRKSNSLQRTPSVSAVGSPASVSSTSAPFNANSPSVGTPPAPLHSGPKGDPAVFERFSKIEMVTQRYRLNNENRKVDQFLERKLLPPSPELVACRLSSSEDTEEFKDATMPMSKSLVGGSINVCKIRILTFVRMRHVYPGNGGIPFIKLVLSEKPKDGTVETRIVYGTEEESDPFAPLLPSTYRADLFAAQFTSSMVQEGYQLTDDQIQPTPVPKGASSGQPTVTTAMPGCGASELPHSAPIMGQSLNATTPLNSGISTSSRQQLSPHNMLAGSRVLPPGNLQALQLPSGYLFKPQPETAAHLNSMQQQHHPQVQKSMPLICNNLLGTTNLQMGNQGLNNPSNLHFHLQQRQRHQLQQQSIMQRKMMAGGLGPGIGLGNMGTMHQGGGPSGVGSMANLSPLSNVVGLGAMGGSMSAPMGGQVPGFNSLGQITNLNQASGFGSLNQHTRVGSLPHAQAAALAAKMKLAQSHGRAMMTGGPIRNPVDGLGRMAGNMMMPGGSMSSQTIGRGIMPQLQCASMTSMGPPKVPIMNFYMNNQQQQQIQQQQVQKPQQMGSSLQQQQQPQICAPLQQQLGSPLQQQQIGSPLQQQQQQICATLQQQMGTPLQKPQHQMGSPHQQPQPQLGSPQPQMGSPMQQLQQQQIGSPLSHVSPQQMNQQTPMSPQISSGAVPQQQMIAGSVGMGPNSPQLSSQTLGSVAIISSSPMELQGVSKGASVSTGLVGGE